jgi:flagellar hook-length control protein FliK
VELTLQPEELGKVRMTMSAGQDGAMTMSLQAERPETLDLLRRHIGDLARELQDLGFSNLNFSFGQDRAQAGQQQAEGGRDGDPADRPLAAVPLAEPGFASRPAIAPVSGGLDLRL